MYLIDSANIKAIKHLSQTYAFDGITTNPTLMSKENRTDFLHHVKELSETLEGKRLYVQINADDASRMGEEARAFTRVAAPPVSVKIPATLEGYKAMRALCGEFDIAATAVVDFHQALMSIDAGASSVIVYVNRMLASGLRPFHLIGQLRAHIDALGINVRIIGASFKTQEEASKAIVSGAHRVSVAPSLLERMFLKPLTQRSVSQFTDDFRERYKQTHIKDKSQ